DRGRVPGDQQLAEPGFVDGLGVRDFRDRGDGPDGAGAGGAGRAPVRGRAVHHDRRRAVLGAPWGVGWVVVGDGGGRGVRQRVVAGDVPERAARGRVV